MPRHERTLKKETSFMIICAFLWAVFLHEACGGLGRIQCERPFAGDPSRNWRKGAQQKLPLSRSKHGVRSVKGRMHAGQNRKGFFSKKCKSAESQNWIAKNSHLFFQCKVEMLIPYRA